MESMLWFYPKGSPQAEPGLIKVPKECKPRLGDMPIDECGFVRVLSNPAFSPHDLSPGEALHLLNSIRDLLVPAFQGCQ
jgi:hypothetical protein